MPINRSMMNSLKKEYGKDKGERIYYALEAKKKAAQKSKPKSKTPKKK